MITGLGVYSYNNYNMDYGVDIVTEVLQNEDWFNALPDDKKMDLVQTVADSMTRLQMQDKSQIVKIALSIIQPY